jgi:hypothetical protein
MGTYLKKGGNSVNKNYYKLLKYYKCYYDFFLFFLFVFFVCFFIYNQIIFIFFYEKQHSKNHNFTRQHQLDSIRA